jgi:hypothetical protein
MCKDHVSLLQEDAIACKCWGSTSGFSIRVRRSYLATVVIEEKPSPSAWWIKDRRRRRSGGTMRDVVEALEWWRGVG